jgi:membrane protease YdiL (CAAX protease family)
MRRVGGPRDVVMSQIAASRPPHVLTQSASQPNGPPQSGFAEPGSWQQCVVALATITALVFGGHAVGQVVSSVLATAFPSVNEVVWRLVEPSIVATYQIGLFWGLARWLVGQDRNQALALTQPGLQWRWWLTIVVGLYAVKAATTLIAVMFVQPPEGSAVEAMAPFAELMRLSFWPILVITGIVAAVVEEILYRGFLSRILEQSKLGFWLGAGFAASIWAALHAYYPLPIQLTLVALGVALSWVRRHTGSLYPGMAWHAINNTIGLLALKALG